MTNFDFNGIAKWCRSDHFDPFAIKKTEFAQSLNHGWIAANILDDAGLTDGKSIERGH